MPTNYILIDYENIHLKNLEILLEHTFKIIIFVGENQNKLPFDLVAGIHEFGKDAKYVKVSGTGNNALDFHIAFYIGKIATEEPDAYFHIISKDTGFEPLIKHLRKNKIKVHREVDLAEIPVLKNADTINKESPVLKISSTMNKDEKIKVIVKNLAGRGQSRPRKVKTLTNTINSIFTEKLGNDVPVSYTH